ncbi:MAG: hypothetical protein GY806_13940 [Gammaproteobacteria bacterium]|nr:hypothetical protein [Gammaproteobacteria bacterium]
MKLYQKQIRLRDAQAADMTAVQSIYTDEVLHGVSSWEEIAPDMEEMCNRFRSITAAGWIL